MPVIKLKNEKEILCRPGYANPIRHPASQVIHEFHPKTRAKQIEIAKTGYEELKKAIGQNADIMEHDGRLNLTCFFTMPRGEMILLGILASYYDKRKGAGNLLWWEPEKGN